MRSLEALVVLATACTFVACGDPPCESAPEVGASSRPPTSSSAPAASGTPAASSASSAKAAPSGSALAPPRKDLPAEEREREMARILAGDIDAQALPLADTEPGEEFDFRLRRALASQAEVRIGEPVAEGAGSPDSKLVTEALTGRTAKLRRCYLLGLANNPNLMGRVGMNVVLAGAGKPKSVENGGSDLPDMTVVECVIAEVGRISFPAPSANEAKLKLSIMFVPGP